MCYRSRQKKVWYRICDLFAKINLSLVHSANKNFKLTSLSPVEFSYETGPFGAMCGLYAALVRSLCGLCATSVRYLAGFGAVFVLFWCDFGAVFVLF